MSATDSYSSGPVSSSTDGGIRRADSFVGLCYMALALVIGLSAGRIERRVAVRR